MLRSSESVFAETKEPGSELSEFKLINTGFAPSLERSDALPEDYRRSGKFGRRDLHLFWVQLNEEWFIRSLVTDKLQLFDRSSKPITLIEIHHPDLRAMTKANSDDAILATLTTSSISEWKIDAANKSLTLVREMKFSPTLRDSKSLKKSIELKLEDVLDRDYEHQGNVFTTFEKMPGNNLHRYIASSEKCIPHTWDGPQWRDFEPVCESEDDKRRLINAKLYLFDLLNNKSLVIDFPKNATGYTFIEPDLIAFNDLYNNGIWLCDIHFDAVTGPSIMPHAQQQTMVLSSMTSCLLAGKEYWLEIRGNDNQPWYTLPKLSEEALKAAAEAKKIHDERFRSGGRKIPEEKSEGDAEKASIKSFLEKKSDPDSERLIALAREFAGQETENKILSYRGGLDMGFAMHQVKLSEGQYTMQSMPCPETRSLFYTHFANNIYDTINGAEKYDLFHFISHPKEIYEDEINMFVPSMNLMIRYPMSRAFSDCEVIASPDCYQFTAIFERKKVMQSFRLPNPKLITTLETAFAEIDSKLKSFMPKGVLDIVRGYVQKEPENFRGLFQAHGVFSRKPKMQKNPFSLHFLDMLESAYLYINSGIEEGWRYLNFRRSAPVALDNAEFNVFLVAARSCRQAKERDELFKRAFYLYAGLIYVINQCKLSVNTDIEAIIDQAMKMLSNPETRFRNCLELHNSPDTQSKYRALVNNGRNPEILSVVERMLRSTVQTAAKLAPQVGKEAEEDFASSMVMSAKRN